MSFIPNLPSPQFTPPLLSVRFAVRASTLFTLSYVASLYVSPSGRLARTIHRDHPIVMRSRIKTASLSTALIVLTTGVTLWLNRVVPRHGWLLDTLNISRLLGLPLPTPSLLTTNMLPFNPSLTSYFTMLAAHVVSPLVLTSMLFLAPLYVCWLDGVLPFQRSFSFSTHIVHTFTTLSGIRNFVVGPITEELVFRASILTLFIFAGMARTKLLLVSPMFFAIAHIHHAYNVFVSGGSTKHAAVSGMVIAVVQFAYTMVFGWYANFLFLRSASVVATVVAHVFCNLMGLPHPLSDANRHPTKARLIWALHAIGIVLFTHLLFPLTSPSIFGPSLYWS